MDKFHLFWKTMELCNWDFEGDDNKVLEPVIQYLSQQDDAVIFEFDDLMSELLYDLDTKKLADACQKTDPYMSDDSFLYSRCVALVNGQKFYKKVKRGKENSIWDMEFESILYVPARSWALKHQKSEEEYEHFPALSYETGSNVSEWK